VSGISLWLLQLVQSALRRLMILARPSSTADTTNAEFRAKMFPPKGPIHESLQLLFTSSAVSQLGKLCNP
jgi:hypothetical protein